MTAMTLDAVPRIAHKQTRELRAPAGTRTNRAGTGATDLPAEMLHQASVALVATDLTGRVTYLNRGAEELYGANARYAVGRPVKDVVALPDDGESVDEIVGSVAANGQWVGETWARRADGVRIPVLLTVTPLRSNAVVVGMIGIAVDNTKHHEAEAAHAHLAAAVEQTAESVMIADAQARILYVNPAFERVSGYTLAEVVGKNPRILQSGVQPRSYYKRMWRTLMLGRTWKGELVNRHKDGSLFREEATITPVVDSAGQISTFVAVKRDVTRLREIEATLDEATRGGLAVAQALDHLSATGSTAETAHEIAAALLTLPGIDRGGVIAFDDSGGATLLGFSGPSWHPIGESDQMPAARAEFLRERARLGPWVEMTELRPRDGDYTTALATSGLRAAAYAPIGTDDPVGLIAIGTDDEVVAKRMVNLLPMAVQFAATATHLLGDGLRAERVSSATRTRIESMVRASAFHAVFQPVVKLDSGKPIGFEALTRFDNGTTPDRVFRSAVSVGLGLELEIATLRSALDSAQALPKGLWLSLNVSPALILEHDRLFELLSAQTRPIVLEITEHELIPDYDALREAFLALGPDIRLAVDDAGAGVANFGHIVELRPDFVKIDIGLIRGVNVDRTRQALVVGLDHFARTANCFLIAEGVETVEERAALQSLGIRFGQGYLLGRPGPAGVD